ncbi:MAG: AbrB/MazE/SpoVT family DNA-binding domain-containing protein [Bifidobacteriaceae bacterium]|nr:AbrB/MazE/SpoVT family DNA-binding domain-containing protein [Bifidobacteriaceae bacterium]
MAVFVSVQDRGTIALPARIRQAYHLNEPGAQVEVIEEAGRIVLVPKLPVDAAQAWFWSDGWQTGEHRAAQEDAQGEGTVYNSAEEFLADLD